MKLQKLLFVFLLGTFALSCSVEPVPIDYGHDECDFCRMTIVDNQHAAEAVTTKGRATKYDAIECLINHLATDDMKDVKMKFILVNDYNSPGALVDAHSAWYLVSEAIPSPMGANLSAFAKEEDARLMAGEKGGEVYDWEAIKSKIARKH